MCLRGAEFHAVVGERGHRVEVDDRAPSARRPRPSSVRRRRAGRAHGRDLADRSSKALSEDATAPRRKKGLEGSRRRARACTLIRPGRSPFWVSGGFEAGEPNSESISRSAIAELIVRSSFSARRSVWGARFDAVEKSNLFGFMFVMTIESPGLELAEGPPRGLRGLIAAIRSWGPTRASPRS